MKKIISLLLLLITLLAVQTVHAASTFTVTNTSGTSKFVITRTTNTSTTETVKYRTVSLSAIEGQHFTAVSGELSFAANDTSKTVTVTESTPGTDAYKYQTGTERTYRFEVLDKDGYVLASKDRSITSGLTTFSGAKVSKNIQNMVYFKGTDYASDMESSKYVDVSYTPPTSQVETSGTLSGYVLIDDSYDYAQKPATVSTSTLINSTNATTSYLNTMGCKIYATVCFTEKEKDDGYQYIQIIAGTASSSYDTGADPNGAVNDPSNSVYKVCFELSEGSNAEGKQYFPHLHDCANKSEENTAHYSITEFSQTNGHLWQQKFKSGYRASNTGALIFAPTVSNITTRFDAGGENNDTWGYKDFFVRMALCDATAPTVLNNYKVSGGRHQKGNVIYVSVPFSEIVTVSGTPTLATSWGTLSYCAGSGTNVLTFRGEISSDAAGTFIVTSYSGTIKDLAGNAFSGTISKDYGTSLDADYAWTEADFHSLGGSTYEIATKTDLRHLALLVNAAKNPCTGLTFRQTQDITCDATYIPIGYYVSNSDCTPFRGTYDGQGHTVSGITVSRTGNTNADGHMGLFGYVHYNTSTDYGTVKNVVLANSTFTGSDAVGGIVGYNRGGTVRNCRVESSVTINAGQNYANSHGGIVGDNHTSNAKVIGCYSAAVVSVNGKSNTYNYGGIVGYNANGTVKDCLYAGNTVTSTNDKGAIVGCDYDNKGFFSNNYYTAINLGGVNGSDRDGARRARTVSLGTGVALSGTQTAYNESGLTAIGTTALQSGSTIYSGEGQTVNVAYSGTVPEGFIVTYSATAGSISGTALTLAAAVTVSATCAPDYATHWHADADHDGTTADRAYIITTTTGLNLLATLVNGTDGYIANTFESTYFKLGNDITYTHTTNWNDATSTENNYTAIGARTNNLDRYFCGTFDGQGHTVRGIRIYKRGTTYADSYQGLFGSTSGATIRNVILADARITGNENVGGIAGYITYNAGTGSIVENCRVGSDVCIHAVAVYAFNHGGVVGKCYRGTISGCVSSATLTVANAFTGISAYGGIVGDLGGNMSDCLSIGTNVPAINRNAAIAGRFDSSYTLTNNYYYNCTLGSATTNVGIGWEDDNGTPHDRDGARSVHSVTLPTGVTATGESVTIGTDIYYASNTTVTLNVPTIGYSVTSYNDGADHNITGNTFTMPAADVTVSATLTDVWGIASGKDGTTVEKAYTITSTAGLDLLATLVNTGNEFQNKFFKLNADITYSHKADNEEGADTENNFTTIGVYIQERFKCFCGILDGQGHTISGIRIYKGGDSSSDDDQGLFRWIYRSEATIKNVILADTRITGRFHVGGIVGKIHAGTVENCRVGSDVTIHAATNYADCHGGVVGVCTQNGTIRGCVSSAILTVADGLTDISNFGGIVGGFEGNMSDCLALDATMPAVTKSGAIAGSINARISTQTNCYHRDCTVGGNGAPSNTYNVSAYTVSAGTYVTMAPAGSADTIYEFNGIQRYGDALYYGGVIYAPRDASVSLTLGYNGSVPTDSVGYGASVGTLSGDANPYTLTMPDENVTIGATFTKTPVTTSYVEADGTLHENVVAIPLDNTMTTLAAGWYVVNSDVAYTGTVTLAGDVNIILADGKTMSVTNTGTGNEDFAIYGDSGPLHIYGQSQGTGALTATANSSVAIKVDDYITINGGTVTATSTSDVGIYGIDGVTINGGTVNANGIYADGDITINGGKVTNNSDPGIRSNNGNITLSCTSASDFIQASSYSGTAISVADGKTLVDDGGNIWSGTLSNDDLQNSLLNKTLRPVMGVVLTKDGSGNISAEFDGTSLETVSIPINITVNSVTLNRTFNFNKCATLMLPFSLGDGQSLNGGILYKFDGVNNGEGDWVATLSEFTSPLKANTPYLIYPNGHMTDDKITFDLNGGTVTLNTTTAGEDSNEKDDLWDFIGTYSYIKWTSDTGDQDYSTEREAEIGKVYGFAAVEKIGIHVGDFVRVASGAKIRPMCAYLKWKGSIPNNARALTRAATNDETELPQRITVRLIGADGVLTGIGEIDTRTGDITFDAEGWYTLDGIRLNGKPVQSGIYINNGKKVSIKYGE